MDNTESLGPTSEALTEQVATAIQEPVAGTPGTDEGFRDWENLGLLFEMDVLSTQHVKRYLLTLSSEQSDEEVARIEWIVSPPDYIGYIHWTHVNEKYRRNGIGTMLRAFILARFRARRSVDYAYAEAYSTSGKNLIKSFDWVQLEDADHTAGISSDRMWYTTRTHVPDLSHEAARDWFAAQCEGAL